MSTPQYEIVVYGATGYVGQLICRYLVELQAQDPALRWAMAGRNLEKLKALARDIGAPSENCLYAQACDCASLAHICAQTKVILSTVGPYNRYGEALIAECVRSGTDYVDLCGEVLWLKEIIERYGPKAQTTNARLVPACGFDSVPSDLGTFFLQAEFKARHASYCNRIKMRVVSIKGGLSGGTLASMTDSAKMAASSPKLRRAILNPYLLSPPSSQERPRQNNNLGSFREEEMAGWMAPFLMEGINSRIVHRSNGLMDFAYGQDFRYDEAMYTGTGVSGWLYAQGINVVLSAGMLLAALGPTRQLLHRFVLPNPGQGPSERTLEEGHACIQFWGSNRQGKRLRAQLQINGDPGYLVTAKMLTQGALCLARDRDKGTVGGGFWTPATALGRPYLQRLRKFADMQFEIIEAHEPSNKASQRARDLGS